MFASCVYERRAIINLCGKMQDKTFWQKPQNNTLLSEKREKERKVSHKKDKKKKTQNHPEFPALFFPSF